MRQRKLIAAGCIAAMLVAVVVLGGYPGEKQAEPTKTPAVTPPSASQPSRPGTSMDAGSDVASLPPATPTLEQHQAALEAGKLSPEEEEQLRLGNFQQYLHYKSRQDGTRDRELIDLEPHERKNAVRKRVRDKLVEAMAKEDAK